VSRRAVRHFGAWLALARALIVVIFILSLAPLPAPPLDVDQGDKIGHLLAYFALMFSYAQLFATRRALAWRAVAFVAMGGAIEVLQSFTPYRHADVLDLVADGAGVALGLALGLTRAGDWLQRMLPAGGDSLAE
jgi:VanZ family protein